MEPSCRGFSALAASLLVLLFLMPPSALAAPLNATTVHDRIVKRGLDHWVCVKEDNGIELVGRILAIKPQSFLLQLPNDPEPVEVFYSSVIDLRTGFTRGQKAFIFSTLGASAAFAIWAAVHFHNVEQQPHYPPTLPGFPAIP